VSLLQVADFGRADDVLHAAHGPRILDVQNVVEAFLPEEAEPAVDNFPDDTGTEFSCNVVADVWFHDKSSRECDPLELYCTIDLRQKLKKVLIFLT
jgi:hypothetical protein